MKRSSTGDTGTHDHVRFLLLEIVIFMTAETKYHNMDDLLKETIKITI